jgi:hypothetical protein
LKPEFGKLVEKLKKYEMNRFETRAFMYLDIISWLESKIQHVPVQDVIFEGEVFDGAAGGVADAVLRHIPFVEVLAGKNLYFREIEVFFVFGDNTVAACLQRGVILQSVLQIMDGRVGKGRLYRGLAGFSDLPKKYNFFAVNSYLCPLNLGRLALSIRGNCCLNDWYSIA